VLSRAAYVVLVIKSVGEIRTHNDTDPFSRMASDKARINTEIGKSKAQLEKNVLQKNTSFQGQGNTQAVYKRL